VAPSLAIAALAISVNLAATSLVPRSAHKAVTTP
jgi:peptide/nickel transport system permease protein